MDNTWYNENKSDGPNINQQKILSLIKGIRSMRGLNSDSLFSKSDI